MTDRIERITGKTLIVGIDIAKHIHWAQFTDSRGVPLRKPLKVENKNDYTILNNAPAQSTRIRKEKAFNVKDSEWLTVKDDIYKKENWGQYKK